MLESDDHRRVVGLNEIPVGEEPSYLPVAIGERMNALKPGVALRDTLGVD